MAFSITSTLPSDSNGTVKKHVGDDQFADVFFYGRRPTSKNLGRHNYVLPQLTTHMLHFLSLGHARGYSRKGKETWAKWKNGGKWGEMVGNGYFLRSCQTYLVGNVENMCEMRRKLEGNRRKIKQLGTTFPFFLVLFPFFFTLLPTFPQVPLMNFANRTSRLKNGKFLTSRQWPIFQLASSLVSATLSAIVGLFTVPCGCYLKCHRRVGCATRGGGQ